MSTTPLPPHFQALLERLLAFFSAYVAAHTTRERDEIHNEILSLFSELGVVSDSALVRKAADIFESLKREPVTRRPREESPANEARQFVTSRLRELERTGGYPALSAGARQLLRIPVVEATELSTRFDPEQVSRSLDRLFESLAETPASRVEGTGAVRTSIAVIRAFSNNFCRIPPFCSGR